MCRIDPEDNDARLRSMVNSFLTFVLLCVVATAGLFIGFGMAGDRDRNKCDVQGYIERCQTMRQHAMQDSESDILRDALVKTMDYIEQVKTPGFSGELP